MLVLWQARAQYADHALERRRQHAAEFFRRWKVFEGKEAQQIFKLAALPLAEPAVAKVLSEGMKLAVLKGVDPNPSNFVIAGWLSTKGCPPQGDAASVLMRLEVNEAAGVCRISVRSGSGELNTALSKLIWTCVCGDRRGRHPKYAFE